MTALFMFGALLLLISVLMLTLATQGSGAPRGGVARSLAALEAMGAPAEIAGELDRPFSERIMAPLQARALGIGRRLTNADAAERIRHKIESAGSPTGWTVDRVVSLKVLGAIAGPIAFVLFASLVDWSTTSRIVMGGLGLIVGWKAPDMALYQKTHDRNARMSTELADAIDLLTISVEAGLAFDGALQQVARNTDGPLAEEFSRVLKEMQIGHGRSEALRALADRVDLPDLRSFVSALVQADAFGIPIGRVLRVQSTEMRIKRRQAAEEKAQQVPVKMTVPLIILILPCLFLVVMGPAALSLMNSGI